MATEKKKATPKKKAAPKKKRASATGVTPKKKRQNNYTKKPNGKNATGRTEFKPTNEQRNMVATLSACGFTQEDLCKLVASSIKGSQTIDVKTLKKHFSDELDTGKVKANAKVAATLYNMASSGQNTAATIFYCRTQLKFNTRVELADPDGRGVGSSFVESMAKALLESGDLTEDELHDANTDD